MKKILYLGLDPSSYIAQGHVTHCPLIRIVPRSIEEPAIQQALQAFSSYTHIILTSKSTVDILLPYLAASGYSASNWKDKTIFVVGQATAKRLQHWQIEPNFIAKQETAEGIIADLQNCHLKNAQCFWPHSAQARSVITDFCRLQEIPLISCILYDTQFQIPSSLPEIESFDEIVFTSPSTVQAFLQIYSKIPCHKQLTALGPITEVYLTLMSK